MVTKTKKIFVGGLSSTSTVEDVKGYFEQFGKVHGQNKNSMSNSCIRICEISIIMGDN